MLREIIHVTLNKKQYEKIKKRNCVFRRHKSKQAFVRGRKRIKRRSDNRYIIYVITVIRSAIATLRIPRGDADKALTATAVVKSCSENTNLPVPLPTIVINQRHIAEYEARTPSTKAELWRIVKVDLYALKMLTQAAANAAPERSIEIIISAGFTVKDFKPRQKGVFTVKNGVDSVTIDLTGPTVKGTHCHDWWYSADNITYVRMRPTLDAATQMTGLEPVTHAWFKHELIVSKDPLGLSAAIQIMVI